MKRGPAGGLPAPAGPHSGMTDLVRRERAGIVLRRLSAGNRAVLELRAIR